MNATVLWVIAVILAIVGIVQLLQGQIIFGIVLARSRPRPSVPAAGACSAPGPEAYRAETWPTQPSRVVVVDTHFPRDLPAVQGRSALGQERISAGVRLDLGHVRSRRRSLERRPFERRGIGLWAGLSSQRLRGLRGPRLLAGRVRCSYLGGGGSSLGGDERELSAREAAQRDAQLTLQIVDQVDKMILDLSQPITTLEIVAVGGGPQGLQSVSDGLRFGEQRMLQASRKLKNSIVS